jgi:hypothetical protein
MYLLKNILNFDAPEAWGLYFQDSATPLPKWSGKSFLLGIKLPNSGDALKILIPSHIWKYMSGWTNYSGMVTSQNIYESLIGNRGSKSVCIDSNITVKEQRVDGSWHGNRLSCLRYTLMGFERNYPTKILTNQLVNTRSYSTSLINEGRYDNNPNLIINPYFLTGFADAEGSFVLSITKSNHVRSGWVIKPRFQIHLHKKDLFVLEAIKNFLGVGKIYAGSEDSVQYRVFSIKDLKVVLDHFDKFPLISQKYGDYILLKKAYLLMVKGEHLTPEGLGLLISIRASINNGLSPALKEAFPNIIPAVRPLKENISIDNPQWLAGFTSGEGSFGIKIRNAIGNSQAVIELIFQINQHVRDKKLIACIAEYLNCGKIYRHSANAIVYRVSKRSDLIDIILPFFVKSPILGVKALDFKDFCFILDLIKNNAHHNKEGLNQINSIKANMNSGRAK